MISTILRCSGLSRIVYNQNVLGVLGKQTFSWDFIQKRSINLSPSKMNKRNIYITREIKTEPALKLLEEQCNITMWKGTDQVPREELLKNIEDKDGLFCMLTDRIDKEVLEKAGSKLKVIATMSVGYDHLDVEEIQKRNIKIGYTPNVLTDSTAELTLALLLATSRRIIEGNVAAKLGEWQTWAPYWMCGQTLNNSTVGIVGFGRIGQQVARLLQPFKLKKLLYQSRTEKPLEARQIGATRAELEALLAESDFVIVTCALTPATKLMFNDYTFKKMKPSAVFINSSRGGIVDQDALVRALTNKTIWAAGLDVTTPEPLPPDHPLFKLKNCVVLPHIGSAAIETRNTMAILTAKNLIAGLNGEDMPAELRV